MTWCRSRESVCLFEVRDVLRGSPYLTTYPLTFYDPSIYIFVLVQADDPALFMMPTEPPSTPPRQGAGAGQIPRGPLTPEQKRRMVNYSYSLILIHAL